MDDESSDPVPPEEATAPEEAARNPKPIDICLTIETVDLYKKSDCRFYTKCMDLASIKNWQQFHCNECTAYVPIPETARRNKTLLRLALLLEKVRDSEDDKDDEDE